MPPMPSGYNTDYRPPVPPSPTYNSYSRGDRHAESKEAYEMSQRPPQEGMISTDQFFQEVKDNETMKKKKAYNSLFRLKK